MNSYIITEKQRHGQTKLTRPGLRQVPDGTGGSGLTAGPSALSTVLASSPLGSDLFTTLCLETEGGGNLRHFKMNMVLFCFNQ